MVWGKWCHPEEELLQNVQKEFVEHVSNPLISEMLDNLLTQGVLSLVEAEEVQDQCRMHMDKAWLLINIVLQKGTKASQIFTDSLRVVEQLGLS